MSEFEVWQGLANLYSSLSHWKDVEVCLEKAGALKQYSPEMLHAEGKYSIPNFRRTLNTHFGVSYFLSVEDLVNRLVKSNANP